MNYSEVMRQLEELGTAQNRKVYQRHGSGQNLFGVSFANLEKLRKKIGHDDDLAQSLWESENADAMILSLMIRDPARLKPSVADALIRDQNYYVLVDYIAKLVARSPIAVSRIEKWIKSRKEFVRQCGYSTISSLLAADPVRVSDADAARYLERIENEIHHSANRARHAMNMTLASIGIFKPGLRETAIAAAERIGVVEVDHGETGCRTPDAAGYIRNAIAQIAKRTTRKSTS